MQITLCIPVDIERSSGSVCSGKSIGIPDRLIGNETAGSITELCSCC